MKTETNMKKRAQAAIGSLLGIVAALFSPSLLADVLYIGDGGDNTVKRFDAETGVSQGTFVAPTSGGLFGPRGLAFAGSHLLVANQNVDQPFSGEVLDFDEAGIFFKARIPASDPKAPFAPRGIIRGRDSIFVADLGDADYVINGGIAPNPLPARVAEFDQGTGKWKRDLNYSGFAMTCSADNECVQWSPRAAVFGPDGALYVSAMKFVTATNPNTLFGRIIRFPRDGRGAGRILVDGDTCGCGLARPEGLTFGPDGRLYVASFRINGGDNDKILIFNAQGKFVDQIDLDLAGEPRAFAQALIFGPKGKLYVPINNTGEVRRYNVRTKRYSVFVPTNEAGGALINPWYLTFGETDPRTLRYDD